MAMTISRHDAASLAAIGHARIPDIAQESPTTLPYRCGECRVVSSPYVEVTVQSSIPVIVRQIQGIFSAPGPEGGPDWPHGGDPLRLAYEVSRHEDEHERTSTYEVTLDGRELLQAGSEDEVLYRLEGAITDRLMRSLSQWHLFHAGAVARRGRGILLPGPSGVGKSTLVAALSLTGFDYCSDELAVVGDDASLRPFPKIPSLKKGGWLQIAHEFPDVEPSRLVSGSPETGIWYVRPSYIPGAEQARRGYPVSFVVLPRYDPSGETSLRPIPRSVAMALLVDQCLDLSIWGVQGFELIIRLVRQGECYALDIGSLPRAVALLEDLTQ